MNIKDKAVLGGNVSALLKNVIKNYGKAKYFYNRYCNNAKRNMYAVWH